MNFFTRFLATVLFAGLFSWSAMAQQSIPPSGAEPAATGQQSAGQSAAGAPADAPAPQPDQHPAAAGPEQPAPAQAGKEAQEADRGKEILKEEEHQRILGLAPMFGMTSHLDAPALTTSQKFHLFMKASFDPFQYAAAGLQAGIGQAEDEFQGYGQGAEGYGKRYGATLADQVSSNFFSNFFWPTLLKEDPRYFRLGEGSVKHRLIYSLEQEFICHKDRGGRSFNWSNVLGSFSTGGLSNVYYPSTDRGVGLTLSRSSIALLYGSVGGLVDEFWPDVSRKLLHKKH